LARECNNVKIDRVYIGSCTGGKTEDFMAAAKVFLAGVCLLQFLILLYILYNIQTAHILWWRLEEVIILGRA